MAVSVKPTINAIECSFGVSDRLSNPNIRESGKNRRPAKCGAPSRLMLVLQLAGMRSKEVGARRQLLHAMGASGNLFGRAQLLETFKSAVPVEKRLGVEA